jgi:hypothetical protein
MIPKILAKMPVVAADGRVVGFVSRVDAHRLKLTSVREGRGFEHVLPMSWVADVERYVFLSKGSRYVAANWDAPAVESRRQSQAA